MEEYPGGAIITMKAKDQRVEAMEEEAQGGEPLLLSSGGAGALPEAIIITAISTNTATIFTIIITILISFTRSTLLHPIVIPYLNMVRYATYYDPMMCCHPMMF